MSLFTANMLANAGGSVIPTDGLIFYASFRNGIQAETGQQMSGEAMAVFDSDLNRNVCAVSRDTWLEVDMSPTHGNEPFTMSLLAQVLYRGSEDIIPLMVWGTTPYGPTVAALRWQHDAVTLTAWGDLACNYVSMPMGTWHHLCGVNPGDGHPVFYFDGIKSSVGDFNFDVGDLVEEYGGFSFNSFWSPECGDIRIANARVYNRALSDLEVKSLASEV